MRKVIAIDGPSGAGKSTLARRIAHTLGFSYLDTGALYRAVGLRLCEAGLNENADDEVITSALSGSDLVFRDCRIFLDGRDVSEEIRTPEASHYASVFSARESVRGYLFFIQRNAAEHADLVAEGRDMTTVVFPDAYRKFFLDASVEERTRRRTLELAAKGFDVDMNRVRADIIERDGRDSARTLAPLKKAEDAMVIDTTNLSVEEAFQEIMGIIGRCSEVDQN